MINFDHKRNRGYRLITISLLLMAVFFSGCATKQHLMQVESRIQQIGNDQKLLNAKLDHIDSLITDGAGRDNSLRVEIRSSLGDISDQMTQLKNRLDDLQQLVFEINQRSSQGATTVQPLTVEPQADPGQTTEDTSVVSKVDCRHLWDNAFKDMRRGHYDLAISGFSDYLRYCPRGDLSDNSQYWIAEAYYEMKQFEQAITEYDRLLSLYPESEKRATVYFKLGRSYEELDDKEKALENFLVLKNDYPGTLEFEQVKDKIAEWEKEN